eukprot:2976440-Rhodomonas_salina.3
MVALCQYQGRYDATRTAVPTWAHLLVHALPGVLAVLEVLEGLVPGRRTIMVSNVEKSERLRKTRRGLQPHEEKLAVRMPRPSLLLRHVPPPWDSVGFQAFQKGEAVGFNEDSRQVVRLSSVSQEGPTVSCFQAPSLTRVPAARSSGGWRGNFERYTSG